MMTVTVTVMFARFPTCGGGMKQWIERVVVPDGRWRDMPYAHDGIAEGAPLRGTRKACHTCLDHPHPDTRRCFFAGRRAEPGELPRLLERL